MKRRPPTTYAAKFSTPFGVALGLVRGHAHLKDFTEAAIIDDALLNIARIVDFEIDPDNPYPDQFTGHVRLVYSDGRVEEAEQGFMRGGADAPLSRQEIEDKFRANVEFGGCDNAGHLLAICDQIGSGQGNFKLIEELGGQ